MNTKEIIDALNIETENKYGFSFKDALLDSTNECCNIEIYYKDGVILSFNERHKAEIFLESKLPEGFKYNFKFIKNFVTKDTIVPQIDTFFKENMPSVLYSIIDVKTNTNEFDVSINIDDKSFDYFSKKDGNKVLKNYLEKTFCSNFNINCIDKIEEEVEIEEDINTISFTHKEDSVIDIENVTSFIGELIEEKPSLIKNVAHLEGQDICVCGKIKFLKELTYERKSKKSETEENNEKLETAVAEDNTEKQSNFRVYYKWNIEGFTGEVSCIYFTNKQTKELMPQLANGDEIVVCGTLEKNKFNDKCTLKVKRISRCKRPEKYEEKVEWKTENKNYIYVIPEPIEITKQVDLFGMVDEVIPEYLKNKNIVVFDFETTGLSAQAGDKIIEIGAVKIVDGKIKDKFTCLVNPEMPIPPDSTKIHGITDADVENSHTIDEVMPDFYKFTRGCYLAGHNIIGFDCEFLKKYGKECAYNFDNEVIDTYPLSTKYVKGVKNYKLGTLTAHYGIILDNAHRAWYDCYANAELLIKIADLIKE